MRSLLLALLVCAACKHTSSSSSTSHTETQTTTDTTSSESGATTTTTTVTEAPGETTTTTEEFAPPDDPPVAAGTGPEGPVSPAAKASDGRGPVQRQDTRHGLLVKRTVTVTKSGGETTETRSEAVTKAQGATETRETGKVDAKAKAADSGGPSVGCIGASWLWGAAVLVGVVGVLYFAIKMRKSV